jgi:hypothetical protein
MHIHNPSYPLLLQSNYGASPACLERDNLITFMKMPHTTSLLAALGVLSLVAPASAAPKSRVKERGSIVIDIPLAAEAGAPVGVAGSAQIEITKEKFKSAETAELTLTTSGLAAGSYSVDATVATSETPVHLGDLVVTATPATGPLVISLPPLFDAENVTGLTVTDSATLTVLLSGVATATSVDWKYIANVRVEAPDIQTENALRAPGGGKGGKVHGHVISQSFIKDSVETKRHFLWVAQGAPKDTELTINVDGVAQGTVTSSKSGKVFFQTLPAEVVLRNIHLVTLTDSLGTVVMQANFDNAL